MLKRFLNYTESFGKEKNDSEKNLKKLILDIFLVKKYKDIIYNKYARRIYNSIQNEGVSEFSK